MLLVRGRDLVEGKFVAPIRSLYGPFPHGMELRAAMKIVRKIFPYREKCEPWNKEQGARNKKDRSPARIATQARARERSVAGRACFHRQIGLCPGVCTKEISARAYGRTVRNIERFFEGKKASISKILERDMMREAKLLRFERAAEIRRTIFALGHIQDVTLLGQRTESDVLGSAGIRIEGYDVAHFGGKSSVGVMVVCSGDIPDRDAYRKFMLRGKHEGNDLSALEEILTRRIRHPEWAKPDVVVVDGSFLQLGVAERLFFESAWKDVRLVGVVKNARHQPERLIGDRSMIAEHRHAILLANAEAHRFAIGYHRKRRSGDFLKK